MYLEILIVLLLALFVVLYRRSTGEKFYKYVSRSVADVYNKYAPYSFKIVREKTKELGQEYTKSFKYDCLKVGVVYESI